VQPVRRPGFHRQEATRQLVFALGAAFKNLQPALDAEFDGLIVAGFEMQGRVILDAAQ